MGFELVHLWDRWKERQKTLCENKHAHGLALITNSHVMEPTVVHHVH